ncbi:hypothetical protein ACTFIR_005973 [Dictyostelium discoideum]
MKFLPIVFMIVVFGFTNLINCQYFFEYAIKLEPFLTSDCSGEQTGVGYVAKLDTCFTIDDQTSFQLRLESDNKVSVGISENVDCDMMDDGEEIVNNQTFTIGSCIPAIQFDSIHQYLQPFYQLVSLVKVDKIIDHLELPTGSIAMMYRVGTCVSIPLLVEYYTNNTKLSNTSEEGVIDTFYCDENNYPVIESCTEAACSAPFSDLEICETIPNFYNNTPSTGEISGEISGGNTGVKTGTSGHFSGNTIGNTPKEILGGKGGNVDDAFITYTSGHSSGNTIGITPDDKELYDRNGGFQDQYSSTSFDEIYYLSTICV